VSRRVRSVLVDSNWVPKIADFGLSTVDVGEMKGMGVGTGRWRAPEVFKNKPKNCKDQFKGFYTNSSDVYSFGVIVWVRSRAPLACAPAPHMLASRCVVCARRRCFISGRRRGRASWTRT
jgi:serine/threonine protein kinase